MADWTNLFTGLLGAGASIYSANQQSNAIQNAANTAAQQSQFRPVGITTRFGSSGFQYDPSTGQLVGAGYQVAPDVAAMREALLGLSGGQLSQAQQAQAMSPQIGQAAQGLFGLGMGYLGQSPQAAAQQWMSQQQQLLAPGREQELARLTNREYGRGTLGLGVGATQEGYTAAPAMPQLPPMMFAQEAPMTTPAAPAGIQPYGSRTPAAIAQNIANRAPTQPNPLVKPTVPTPMGTGQYMGQLQPIPEMVSTQPVSMQPAMIQPQLMSQGLAASNPRFASLYNARALQDAQLASQAQQEGMEQARFGQGLLGNALNLQGAGYNLQTQALAPFTNYFTAAKAAETAGQQPIDIGIALGTPASAAARAAAVAQQQGAVDAANMTALQNQAAIRALNDPVAALIGQLTGSSRSNTSFTPTPGAVPFGSQWWD